MKKIFFLTEEGRYVFKENSVVEENFLLWVFFDYEENFVFCVISEIPVWAMKFLLRWMQLQESASRLLISICLILKKKIVRFALLERSLSASSTIFFIFLRLNLANWNDRKYKDYTILVHALKSSARIIGAENLSKQAEYLESFGNQLKTAESGVLVSEMRFTTLIFTASWKIVANAL